jgi:uncharacterized protein (UPF0332 family)
MDPEHLLEQAKHLLRRENRRPRQASLRRAVSSAYYALFHLLVQQSAGRLAPGDEQLSALIARSFKHEEMEKACKTFASSGSMPAILDSHYGKVAVPPDLATVARAFVDLQKARHEADYATHRSWTRTEAATEVDRANEAFKAWTRLSQADSIVRLFLAWLVFQKTLQGR